MARGRKKKIVNKEEDTSEDYRCGSCESSDSARSWICCDNCEEWYHVKCTEVRFR